MRLRTKWCDNWRTLSRERQRYWYERSEDMLYAHFADCEWEPTIGEVEDNAMAMAYNFMRDSRKVAA